MATETDIKEIKDHILRIEKRLNHMSEDLAKIKGNQEATQQIIKYVVTPLIIILGALVGLKLFAY